MEQFTSYAAASAEDAQKHLEEMGVNENELSKAVLSDIATAVKYSNNAFEATRSAARLASFEIAPVETDADLAKEITRVTELYVHHFEAVPNLQASFKNLMVCFGAGSRAVTIVRDDKELHTTGLEAGNMAKHCVQAAAKELRGDIGGLGGRRSSPRNNAPAEVPEQETTEGAATASTDGNAPTSDAAEMAKSDTPAKETTTATSEPVDIPNGVTDFDRLASQFDATFKSMFEENPERTIDIARDTLKVAGYQLRKVASSK